MKRPRKLLEDSGSESEADDGPGGVFVNGSAAETPALKINEEYARRFEYNKKREELQQCDYIYSTIPYGPLLTVFLI
jgi:protein KRI1